MFFGKEFTFLSPSPLYILRNRAGKVLPFAVFRVRNGRIETVRTATGRVSGFDERELPADLVLQVNGQRMARMLVRPGGGFVAGYYMPPRAGGALAGVKP